MTKVSIIIASAPDRSFNAVLENLKKIKPASIIFEIIVVKGNWLPSQRNLGIKKATGDYIFFFDDDIIIPAGSIESALKTFQKNQDIQALGGPNITPPENSFIQHCFGYAHSSYFTSLHTAIRYYPAKKIKRVTENHLITCNLAFRTSILKKNLFHPDICPNEENELLGRILRQGHLLGYDPKFIVYHHRRKNIRQYIKQIFTWGSGRTIHSLKKPKHFKGIFFVPVLFLFYLISLIWFHPLWYTMPIILYLILDLFFAIEVSVRSKNPSHFIIMVWLFPITHITYALGLLWGFTQIFKQPVKHPEEKDFQVISLEIS